VDALKAVGFATILPSVALITDAGHVELRVWAWPSRGPPEWMVMRVSWTQAAADRSAPLKIVRSRGKFSLVSSPRLKGSWEMSLQILPKRLRFNRATHSVEVVAEHDGKKFDLIISRAAIEWLRGARGLSQDESFTTVVKHRQLLERAAQIAVDRRHDDRATVDVEMPDLRMSQHRTPPAEVRPAI
jgi:hypothetical protein